MDGRWSTWVGGGPRGWAVVHVGGRWSTWVGGDTRGRAVVLVEGCAADGTCSSSATTAASARPLGSESASSHQRMLPAARWATAFPTAAPFPAATGAKSLRSPAPVVSAAFVSGPAMPSTRSPAAVWKARIASVVIGPS